LSDSTVAFIADFAGAFPERNEISAEGIDIALVDRNVKGAFVNIDTISIVIIRHVSIKARASVRTIVVYAVLSRSAVMDHVHVLGDWSTLIDVAAPSHIDVVVTQVTLTISQSLAASTVFRCITVVANASSKAGGCILNRPVVDSFLNLIFNISSATAFFLFILEPRHTLTLLIIPVNASFLSSLGFSCCCCWCLSCSRL